MGTSQYIGSLQEERRKILGYTPCMKKLALKITPQRSTQYANMTEKLAAPELLASPLGTAIKQIDTVTFAGQGYLLVTLDDESLLPLCSLLEDILPQIGRASCRERV